MLRSHLFNWFFYGHIQIALAAAGLGWLSVELAFGSNNEISRWPIILFLFFATLGVYTLHRYLSYQRAGVRPNSERYNIVARHSQSSLIIGISSLLISGIIGLPFIRHTWHLLLWAIPMTFFYLTPPIKGWKRLRDIRYIKVVFVALAWALMTSSIPIEITTELLRNKYEGLIFVTPPWDLNIHWVYIPAIYFLFIGSIAILFDFRDVVLDRSQGVKTVANSSPKIARLIVTVSMLVNILLSQGLIHFNAGYPLLASIFYTIVIAVTWLTNEQRSEAWYAVVVNGLLWGPVIAMIVAMGL